MISLENKTGGLQKAYENVLHEKKKWMEISRLFFFTPNRLSLLIPLFQKFFEVSHLERVFPKGQGTSWGQQGSRSNTALLSDDSAPWGTGAPHSEKGCNKLPGNPVS